MEDKQLEQLLRDSYEATDTPLAFDRFSFFGIEFKVGSDSHDFRAQYKRTYKHFALASSSDSCITFRVVTSHSDRATIFIESTVPVDLFTVFTRGSNRHRFRVTPAGVTGSWFEVKDAFLGNASVMLVEKTRCIILDAERWRAYAESVVFNTLISLVPNHFLMHAGVVSWQNKGVIFCGEANKGKTTLTLSLVKMGFRFLSDEVAFINKTDKTVIPFPRALGLRENTVSMFSDLSSLPTLQPAKSLSGDAKWLVDIEEMFPGSIGEACNISHIVFLNGFSQETRLTSMAASDALMNCLKFAHTAEVDPIKSMLEVADIIGSAKSYSLVAGPVGQAAETIRELVTS